MYQLFIKPISRLLLSLVLLIVLSPIFLIITLILAIKNRGKVFFVQKRIGLHEKTFYLIKFKTMLDITDDNGILLPDRQRQSGFGNILRHFHLDELPQLINILKGDLNFIGPRPLLVEYVPYYNEVQRKRHNVKPGITGLVQVLGGNALNWDQRLRLDVFYINHQSFAMDSRIFFLTLKYFFKKRMESSEDELFSKDSFIEYIRSQGSGVRGQVADAKK